MELRDFVDLLGLFLGFGFLGLGGGGGGWPPGWSSGGLVCSPTLETLITPSALEPVLASLVGSGNPCEDPGLGPAKRGFF